MRVGVSVSSRGELLVGERPGSDKNYADRGGTGHARAAKAWPARGGVENIV
jgi:hypothetical protein